MIRQKIKRKNGNNYKDLVDDHICYMCMCEKISENNTTILTLLFTELKFYSTEIFEYIV